jgi:hypothetical protein
MEMLRSARTDFAKKQLHSWRPVRPFARSLSQSFGRSGVRPFGRSPVRLSKKHTPLISNAQQMTLCC